MKHLLHPQAIRLLSHDPILKNLIQKYPVPVWEKKKDLFRSLIYEIVGQQLSGKAARVIFERTLDLFDGQTPKPKQLLDIPGQSLRDAGCSWAKIKYLKALAEAVENKSLDLSNQRNLSEQEVYRQLTAVKGIGPWTAEMFLIFTLHRPDVFSLGDLGLRTAVSRLYRVRRENLKKIEKISQAWKPYRSFASRYLWLSLENS